MSTDGPDIAARVRQRYARAARAVADDAPSDGRCADVGCCDAAGEEVFGGVLYDDASRGESSATAVRGSLGCGNPVAVVDLRAGETVLDLGSGGGLDVLLSARRVGPTGVAFGLDMTDEMLALARRNAAEAGVANAVFLTGRIEAIPLPAASVDVAISNCVVNLSADKPAVIREVARVLRPGGRVGISDVVAEDHLTPAERAERGEWVGCIAGALSVSEYLALLAQAGLADAEVTFTHRVADGLHAAVVRAVKPRDADAHRSAGCCGPHCCG